jgi:hypothetical protein
MDNYVDTFLDCLHLRELWTVAGHPEIRYNKRGHVLVWAMPERVPFHRKFARPGRWEYCGADFIFHNIPAVLAGMFLSEAVPDHPAIANGLELVHLEEQLEDLFPHLETRIACDAYAVKFIVDPVQDDFWARVKPLFSPWARKKPFHRFNAGRSLNLPCLAAHDFGAFLWRRHENT